MEIQLSDGMKQAYVDYAQSVMVSNQVETFNNPRFGAIRTAIDESGEPWFCLADVCKALELSQPSRVKDTLREDGVNTIKGIDKLGREQTYNYINEPNLYKCIFQSRKERAEEFQDWVCGDVLPSIRKTGRYAVKPLTPAQQLLANAQMLVEMEQRQMIQERRQDAIEDKVALIEDRIRDNGFMTVKGFANVVKIRVGKATANKIGRMCAKWCKQMQIVPEKIKDGEWGAVNTYPMQALRDVFKATYPDKAALIDVPTYWG